MAIGIGSLGNTSSLFAQNALRLNNLTLSRTSAQLSSGNRLINAGIDPSGISMSAMFRSQIGGIDQAIYNAQDTINLTRTADSTLNTQTDVLVRMRDLAVRSGNDATLSASDKNILNTEYQALKSDLNQVGRSASFNTKQLTTDPAGGTPYGIQTAQIGPGSADQLDVTIDQSTADTLSAGNLAATDIGAGGDPSAAITELDNAISEVSSNRANIGITERRLEFATNDLATQRINMAASNSTIADTDFASTITEQMTANLLSQISIAAISQSNAQGYGVLKLLGQ